MRIAGTGHAVFALTLIGLGLLGLVRDDFAAVWQPVFRSVPAAGMLAALCGVVCLTCGIGTFLQRAAIPAARLLLAWLVIWALLFKAPVLILAPAAEVSWESCGETAVVVAGAWTLYAQLARGHDRQRVGFAAGAAGMRIAHALFGLALIAFGLSHFACVEQTAALVPGWLPAPVAWAWFSGATYIAAGIATLSGAYARLAVALATLQMGLFTALVWVPMALASPRTSTVSELVVSWTLTASAWMVADSWRDSQPAPAARAAAGSEAA